MVIASCQSERNTKIVAQYVRKVYKIKGANRNVRTKTQSAIPRIDGLKNKSKWLSMDMGKK